MNFNKGLDDIHRSAPLLVVDPVTLEPTSSGPDSRPPNRRRKQVLNALFVREGGHCKKGQRNNDHMYNMGLDDPRHTPKSIGKAKQSRNYRVKQKMLLENAKAEAAHEHVMRAEAEQKNLALGKKIAELKHRNWGLEVEKQELEKKICAMEELVGDLQSQLKARELLDSADANYTLANPSPSPYL